MSWRVHWGKYLLDLVHVRVERGIPRLIIHEQYEAHIKWVLRGLWLIGVLSSVVALGPFAGIVLSLLLTLFEQFLERAVFRYTTIVITPLPDFSFSMAELTGMVYARPANPEPGLLPCVGFSFERPDLATRFFDVLRKWNYGAPEDKDDNIQLSFVWPKRGPGYYVCLYPRLDRKAVDETLEQVKAARKESHRGKEQHGLMVVWTIRKFMDAADNLQDFLSRHSPGEPYWLHAFLRPKGTQKTEFLYDIKPILKWNYRVLKQGELKKTDPERFMMRH